MTDLEQLMDLLGLIVVCAPLLLMALLGVPSLLDRKPSEEFTGKACSVAIATGLVCAVAVLALMLIDGRFHVPLDLGDWVVIKGHYHFSVKFVFDRLSVPFVILSFVLCGTIAAFATRYLHREPGYNRFFVLYSMFLSGMVLTALAGTIETMFTGWELVGLSSALLVAFFQERPAPPRNGLRVWVVYRVSDAALLLAAVVMHHLIGEGDFDKMLGGFLDADAWPRGKADVTEAQALAVGLLLLLAAAGKSALVPFSGWLPRAMEGPTPSSAVFYGALSVHLGAFLLLRVSPLLDQSVWLSAAVLALGLTTAGCAYLFGSVQTDIKSALSFASLAQVGVIVSEIGLAGLIGGYAGLFLRYVALFHILGHAFLRTLQFVRAPTLLTDYRTLENAIGARLGDRAGYPATNRTRAWLYRFALERGYLDSVLNALVVVPFVRTFRWFDRLERRWTDFLSGGPVPAAKSADPETGPIDELP
jgi:NAD(P)H-quinone oxidoreductase subunit 5